MKLLRSDPKPLQRGSRVRGATDPCDRTLKVTGHALLALRPLAVRAAQPTLLQLQGAINERPSRHRGERNNQNWQYFLCFHWSL